MENLRKLRERMELQQEVVGYLAAGGKIKRQPAQRVFTSRFVGPMSERPRNFETIYGSGRRISGGEVA